MKFIKMLVENIDEELTSSKEYIEKSLELRVDGSPWADKFRTLASDELQHAMVIHDYTVEMIEKVRQVYTPPEKMLAEWEKTHLEYIERTNWIKQMLNM